MTAGLRPISEPDLLEAYLGLLVDGKPRRPDVVIRCHGKGGRCGEALACHYRIGGRTLLVASLPKGKRSPVELRSLRETHGRLPGIEGGEIHGAWLADLEPGTTVGVFCDRHGHRDVEVRRSTNMRRL